MRRPPSSLRLHRSCRSSARSCRLSGRLLLDRSCFVGCVSLCKAVCKIESFRITNHAEDVEDRERKNYFTAHELPPINPAFSCSSPSSPAPLALLSAFLKLGIQAAVPIDQVLLRSTLGASAGTLEMLAEEERASGLAEKEPVPEEEVPRRWVGKAGRDGEAVDVVVVGRGGVDLGVEKVLSPTTLAATEGEATTEAGAPGNGKGVPSSVENDI